MYSFEVNSSKKQEFIDITAQVRRIAEQYGADKKLCVVFIPHTTAAVTINENADPDVKRDIITALNAIIPQRLDYKHIEGNSPAHIMSSLTGVSESIIVVNGRLVLGTWQGIYLTEFDGPRTRKVLVELL
ncbi:MAG: secondary thiamine-phosphate synthase enzyme YjbQ [Syntrophomonadaceae bacterium]|nr:secondary thiamine-phosphate synthase enzyme YjbQ [Syntrophomonadaceae bacterium]MDD3890296.1 secondary thiamine-phosphate synthase enzyme YjbQ [Syntrophomonadaceae bacterium]MDD4549458.1 secondary thiamine-phosphate synthase enzyme YjbQ [Syntrophomonadaceae bacterium]